MCVDAAARHVWSMRTCNRRAYRSTAHSAVFCGLGRDLIRLADPKDIVTADQNLAEGTGAGAADELLCVGQLDVHIEVDGDESAPVLCLAPLEAHDDILVDEALKQRPGVEGRNGGHSDGREGG